MASNDVPEIRYRMGNANAQTIARELDTLWTTLRNDELMRDQVRRLGLDPSIIDNHRRADVISVEQHGAGLDPATTAIVVAFAPVVAKIGLDLWTEILLPRIKQHLGEDAMGPEQS